VTFLNCYRHKEEFIHDLQRSVKGQIEIKITNWQTREICLGGSSIDRVIHPRWTPVPVHSLITNDGQKELGSTFNHELWVWGDP